MVISEALDRVVSRTGHIRYRDLCNPMHPDYQPEYVEFVLNLAGDRHPVTKRSAYGPSGIRSVAFHTSMVRQIQACPHWVKAPCGCMPNRCLIGKGDHGLVTLSDCTRCLLS